MIMNSSLCSVFAGENIIAINKKVVAKKRGMNIGCISCHTVYISPVLEVNSR